MTYKAKFKKDVLAICKYLKSEFFVREWEMRIAWNDENIEIENRKIDAGILIDNRYLRFTINVYPELENEWKNDKDEFLKILIHEFCHLLTEPLYDIAFEGVSNREKTYLEDVRERQTQRIANILEEYLVKPLLKLIKDVPARKKKTHKRRRSSR